MDSPNLKIEGILDAAERAFARYGYRQSNMELLAREAELSRQGLYLHFSSKSALFQAMIERIQSLSLQSAADAAEQVRMRGGSAADRLIAQINARAGYILERLQGSAHADELIDESNRQCADIADEYSRRFVANVADVIAGEHKAGAIALAAGLSAKKAAHLLVAAARGLKLASPVPSPSEFKRDLGLMVALLFAK